MPEDTLMTIGRFAHLSGVSVHQLRHYDEVGLLVPAAVDDPSRYRRYHRDQIPQARLIRALRWAGVPVATIGRVLDADAAGASEQVRDLLEGHAQDLRRERRRLDSRLDEVTKLLERGLDVQEIAPGCRPVQIKLAVADHRAGVAFYRDALGLPYQVGRTTSSAEHYAFLFGEYTQPGFFLVWLNEPPRSDIPGPTGVTFAIPDVAGAYRAAIAAGATGRGGKPSEEQAALLDPWGNRIGLVHGPAPRPRRLTVTVDELDAGLAFYQDAFNLDSHELRLEDGSITRGFVFGSDRRDDAFDLLLAVKGEVPELGPTTFSFLVDDLDRAHRRALDAGATEVSAPRYSEGMPRGSGVRDPFGNHVGLAQD